MVMTIAILMLQIAIKRVITIEVKTQEVQLSRLGSEEYKDVPKARGLNTR